MPRLWMFLALGLTLAVAQLQHTATASKLQLTLNEPARVYLFKNDRPFRLHPVDAIMPLKVDLFYRDTMWKRTPNPRTLEVTAHDQSHFYLLTGQATFDLPPGDYRVEAYRGLFYTPAKSSFTLKPGETLAVKLQLDRWNDATRDWLTADDHIHLPRTAADNPVFLQWLRAEDLSVGHFLQLQRQIDAAPQYAFGTAGEARLPGYAIRSGQESRSEYYGHINMLGGRELIRPLSVGSMYANEPAASPFPSLLFQRGKAAGALTGFAHFHGSMAHSTMLMDLALGNLDFLEVFQFGKLWTDEWYELLNAGFRITGIAGSDFPVPLGRFMPWPARLPLLGPERAMVKAKPGESAYSAWAAAVRKGEVVVSNGPLVEIANSGGTITAKASFHETLEALELVRNGEVVTSAAGANTLTVSAPAGDGWWAARTRLKKVEGEPQIQAHTNPLYLGERWGKPGARETLAKRWEAELTHYRGAGLPFATETQRREFFEMGERALQRLRQ